MRGLAVLSASSLLAALAAGTVELVAQQGPLVSLGKVDVLLTMAPTLSNRLARR